MARLDDDGLGTAVFHSGSDTACARTPSADCCRGARAERPGTVQVCRRASAEMPRQDDDVSEANADDRRGRHRRWQVWAR